MSLAQNSFLYSANADFIAELFQRYAADPASVDPSWRSFFDGLHQDARSALADLTGASWTPSQEARVIANENRAATTRSEAPSSAEGLPASSESLQDSIRAILLIRSYQGRGHLQAQTDPLGLAEPRICSDLDPADHGFAADDYDRPIFLGGQLGFESATLREILARLKSIYCASVGVEYMHVQEPAEKKWLLERIERGNAWAPYEAATRQQLLERLTAAEGFEKFLATKFVGVKRFGLEGGESMIPALEAALARAAVSGLREVVIGMAHRGRLNMLTNFLGKSFVAMFAEFQGTSAYPDSFQGTGDVKYHLGISVDRVFQGHTVHLTMNANPSHLEWVNPVVTGRVRAKQQQRSGSRSLNDEARREVMALLIHGDAAFAGQGIVAETMTLSSLKGYRTGGTLHFVINNQIGFTTAPKYSRSGLYCTDLARSIQAPIFHVNGDDLDAVARVCELAAAYRQTFHRDVVVDMVCYRRHGHNEGDEPGFTQPLMYEKIKNMPTTRELYAARLVKEGSLTQETVDTITSAFWAKLEQAYQESKTYKPSKADWLEGKWQGFAVATDEDRTGQTGVLLETLREVGFALSKYPQSFDIHPKIARQMDAKREMIQTGEGIDWATAEALAFGTLVIEDTPIRLSGQDSGRGTFSQRHATLFDQKTGERYTPLNSIRADQADFNVHDSPLSEAAVMGFDYGFSLAEPNTLVCWEGQFGDFANTAQVFIDQFISSAETKWMRMSGLVLLLPHGYEGQGPEHSSARLERYLQLCAQDNMQVANCSTPANYFHILRRQMRRDFRKPLILMTPKSLLRHKLCVSSLSDMAEGSSFLTVIPEQEKAVEDKKVRRVVLCSGKVYYDLLAARTERKITDVALVRLEQFYPFPESFLAAQLRRYAKATEIVWCQEEPKNMGAWSFVDRRIEETLATIKHQATRPVYVGRAEGASTSTASLKRHTKEQTELVEAALKN